jgi:hypothetical protein
MVSPTRHPEALAFRAGLSGRRIPFHEDVSTLKEWMTFRIQWSIKINSEYNRIENHIHPPVHLHTLIGVIAVNRVFETPVFDGDHVFGNGFLN